MALISPPAQKADPRPGQDHNADIRVALHLIKGVEHCRDHVIACDRVAPVGVVQGDRCNTVFNV